MEETLRLGLYAIPAFLLLMAIEFISYHREKEPKAARAGVSARDTATSLSIYAIGQLAKPVNHFIQLPVVVIAAAFAPHTLSASDWRVWVAALALADLAYYAKHRMDHRIRLLWAGHSVHHSSQHFNLSTAVRLPWLIPGSFLASVTDVPLALIGIPAWMIFLAHSIVLLFQYPIHTERVDRLPRPIEFVFNTPSHHRVHHGANNPYLDKNYGGILIVWDRMFGSYAEETEPVRYGLTTNIGTHNPVKANYHEFAGMVRDIRRARTWRGRVGFLFGPPGWHEEEAAVRSRQTTVPASEAVIPASVSGPDDGSGESVPADRENKEAVPA
ncbi:sterol desaturase family protein [Streptomyces sp. MCA2]|uniref:sterol desaturase family protein n=1 Tax=Streptomyces sp. MCA2 TaxID=2944805 RepID=UPI002020D449|nr:sterol desaturase family protein [Streptomyces sp. MCA2]MCL7491539.1 sterol desaturase family protein [Streptomyces sp. MCA2]